MNENRTFLEKVAIFRDLDEAALNSVAEMFKERQYKRNEIIFVEEDTGQYMYIVKKGRVKVSRTLPNGKETILTFHKEGEYFGEMALIDGETAPANVTAVVATTILILGRKDFESLLENPTINNIILKILCKRCRDAWAQISVLTFHHADARIRAALDHLSRNRGTPTDRGIRIDLHLTHRELAEMAGISRETATRVLGQLQSEKSLTIEEGYFLISDAKKLVEPLLF
ncbi:MAG: Crp/Fnr family transcriptional regulator [Acidobacteriota bacterium]